MTTAIIAIFLYGVMCGYGATWLAIRNKVSAVWGASVAPLTIVMFWLVGTVWIFSPRCMDVDTCDSGGWLAFSPEIVIAWIIASAGGFIGAFAIGRAIK